jgi:hypothetical protein
MMFRLTLPGVRADFLEKICYTGGVQAAWKPLIAYAADAGVLAAAERR